MSFAMSVVRRSTGCHPAQQAYERYDTNTPVGIFQAQLQTTGDITQRTTDINLHSTDIRFVRQQTCGTNSIDSSSADFFRMESRTTVDMNRPPTCIHTDTVGAHGHYNSEVMAAENTQAPNSALSFSIPIRELSAPGGHNTEPVINTQPVFAMPAEAMRPPVQLRKKKAPTLREKQWAPYKDRILQLHIEMKMSLPQVKKKMEEEYGFKAELRQYRSQITRWGLDKNVKTQEMKAIVRKRQRRKLIETDKNELEFKVRGTQVSSLKIERWMKRQKLPDSLLYAPSPTASTPSDLECRTISERGSPAPTYMHSPAASDPINFSTESPGISSPVPSCLSISSPPIRVFTGKSPTLTYRPLANARSGSYYIKSFNVRPRYRQTDEELLRKQIARASLSDRFGIIESLGLYLRLGHLLIDQGRYKSADELIRKLVNSHRSWSRNENESTLETLYLLGVVLRHQGLYTESENVCRRALERHNIVLGEGHGGTLYALNELGLALQCQNNVKEAEAIYRRILEGLKHVSGGSSFTLSVTANLADTLRNQGRYEEAGLLYQQAIEGSKREFGKEHPETLVIIGNFASMLSGQGSYQKAEAIFQRVVDISVKVLGAGHPTTINFTHSIGDVCLRQGRYQEAEALLQRALKGLNQVLGEKHPETLFSNCAFGGVLLVQGKYEDSEEMYRKALEGYIEVYGEKHVYTLGTFYYLGGVLRRQGRDQEAEQMYRKALEGYIEVYGEKHVVTLNTFSTLGEVLWTQGRDEEAESIFRKELEGRREVLGAGHQCILYSLVDLETVLKRQGKHEEVEALRRWFYEE
ncbi:TPR-like protein [Periconia macrospinosa]|uniref:TPR-like protein n=1 Tax=Periconia macrospinosa TaxID=97972 RepID=A0A2V1DX66_9PLEO|nr:TPR-like protein [Periconia macrospinosa]